MFCFRLLHEDNPAAPLGEAVAALREGNGAPNVFDVDPASFRQVPNAPFAYWVSERMRRLFTELPAFETEERMVKQGLATADDFRFVRSAWETPTESPNSVSRTWFPFAKGGTYSPFYADVYLKVNWSNAGSELDAFAGSVLRNPQYYFRPGLTWPRRTQSGLALRAMPAGCVFADKGPAAFVAEDDGEKLANLLALTTSKAFRGLVELQMAFGSYEVGVIQRTVLPREIDPELGSLAREAWSSKRLPDTANLTSHAFHAPALARGHATLAEGIAAWAALLQQTETTLANLQRHIDEIAYRLYGIEDADRRAIERMLGAESGGQEAEVCEDAENGEDEAPSADGPALVSELLDYALGCAFGRWDIRFATGEKPALPEPGPFEALPACSPGMLQNDEGLPAEPKDVPAAYPLRISWPGILVDDETNREDIVTRVEDVIAVIWPTHPTNIISEACGILGTRSLLDYFRRPSGFFDAHLKRHSKSRRQAPLYWPLSTPSGSYTLWICYQRLSDQTLFTAVTQFIEPKMADLGATMNRLRTKGDSMTTADKDEYAAAAALRAELAVFRDELLAWALKWKPNLNDGVQITAAPLWKYFRHPKWQKTLKDTWTRLERGDYDWAHLAFSLWPDRVREKCKTDKSLAIAHDFEGEYEGD